MKCKVVRDHLLASAKPARPPAVMADHLAQCAGCRTFQRRLVHLERLVPELPVPASSAKAVCLDAVLHSDAFNRKDTPEIPWRQRERALRKVAITFAMAAGLLFFALLMYVWQHQSDQLTMPNSPQAKRLGVEQIVDKYDSGALEAPPRQRMERLAKVAQKLHGAAKDKLETGNLNEVTELANQYETLVRDGVLAHAENLPEPDRKEVLGFVAEQFSRAESDAKIVATQYPLAAKPLSDMALAANKAHLRLRELAGI